MANFDKINHLIIDGKKYSVFVHKDGEIAFHRIEREVTEDFELIEVYNDDITNDTGNPLKVIRLITHEIKNWILASKPHYIWFEANDPKKKRIYEKVFNKAKDDLPEYNYEYQEGKYHLYRKSN